MGPLDQLRAELDRANARLSRETFGSTKTMAQLATEVERRFGNGIPPEKDVITAAVKQFHRSRQVESFRHAKLICYGISTEVLPDRILLLDDPALVGQLLEIVDGFRPQARKYRRCFQALMTAYFEYKPESPQDKTHHAWLAIRNFLRTGISSIHHEPMPEWANKVIEHRNLFEDDPCDPYGRDVLGGCLLQIRETFSTIGISTNSWVQTDVFMAAIRTASNSDGRQFLRHIDVLLRILKENPAIQALGIRYILDRYAQLDSPPDHTALRIFAIDLLGNPLLVSNAPRWDGVSPEARRMVSEWIKLKLIEQFFELLSHDGATDSRRLHFWAEHVSLIENVWFVLGSGARGNLNPDFRNLRRLMGDQALNLEGATYANNAFVMKIGGLLVVEFGETGNAVYLFDARNPPFDLKGALHLRDDLKNKRNLGILKHVDGRTKWEDKFRHAIRDHTEMIETVWATGEKRTRYEWGEAETTRKLGGVFSPLDFDKVFRAFCADRGLRFVDQRAKGGKLIVDVNAANPKISGTLGQWGFKFDRRTEVWTKDR